MFECYFLKNYCFKCMAKLYQVLTIYLNFELKYIKRKQWSDTCVNVQYTLGLLQRPLHVCERLLNLVIFQNLSELSGFIIQT